MKSKEKEIKTIEEKVEKYHSDFQRRVKECMVSIAYGMSHEGNKLGIDDSDIAVCLGRSVAAALFELFGRTDEGEIEPNVKELMEGYQRTISTQFAKEIEILLNDAAAKN